MRESDSFISIQNIADRQIGGEGRHSFKVITSADVIENPFLVITLPPAPDGNYYRQLWPLLFIKKVVVVVGSTVFQEITGDMLVLNYLAHKQEDWVAETVWDLPAEERLIRSSESVEGHISFFSDFMLPLYKLIHSDVFFIIFTGKIGDLLEERDPRITDLANMRLKARVTRYEDPSRTIYNNVRQALLIQENYYLTRTSSVADSTLDLNLTNNHYVSSLYIHLLDENNCEISADMISYIDIVIDGIVQYSVSGLEARTRQRELLAYETRAINSRNMYYVAFFNGYHTGINLVESSSYRVRIHWRQTFPMCSLLLSHRIHNTAYYERGLLSLENSYVGEMKIAPTVPFRPEIPIYPKKALRFQQGDVCAISLEELREGQTADKCRSCAKLFDSAGIQQWLGTGVLSCPNCRCDMGKKGVWRGPLSLTEGTAIDKVAVSNRWSFRFLRR